MFLIKHENKIIPYRGRVVKRGAPKDEDFITLSKGESKTVVFSLNECYSFEQTGTYAIQFRANTAMNHLIDSEVVHVIVE